MGLPQATARRHLDLLAWMEASRGPADTRHLRAFLEEHPDLADAGVVLYTGEHSNWIVDDVLAVPCWQAL